MSEIINNNNCELFELLIDGYVDGEIMPDEKVKLESHLGTCTSCKTYLDDTRKLLEKTAFLPKAVEIPADIREKLWQKIESKKPEARPVLNEDVLVSQMAAEKNTGSVWSRYRAPFAAVSAVVVLVISIVAVTKYIGNDAVNKDSKLIVNDVKSGTFWKVSDVKGKPEAGGKELRSNDSVGIGEWVTTNDSSIAELMVSNIGRIKIEPKSKVKITKSENNEHRVQVMYGTIDADINANPRSFFVDMPTVTAVDLGCSYKLTVDSSGDGLVYVKQGKVSLEAAGRESLVPEGKFCITKKDVGPGTPFRGDASAEFKKALIDFDFGNCAGTCVNKMLNSAKKTDAVTLVSILPRVENDMKERVYAKVSGYVSPPRRIPGDSIPHININTDDLEKWIEKIQEEVHSKMEQSMEQMTADMEQMSKDMDLNSKEFEKQGKEWEEFGKQMQKFGEEFGKEYGKEFQKNWKWDKAPKARDDEDYRYNYRMDTSGFDKEEFKRDMEEMKRDIEESRKEMESEQFKDEMRQSKEEIKRANEEMKNAMKELKKNLKIEMDSSRHKMKIKIKNDNGMDQELEVPVPNDYEAPEVPDVPDTDDK